MNKTNVTVASTKGTSKLVRPKFGPGMLLEHEDLEGLNLYTRDLSRLMFQSLFGCGVICGLGVTIDTKCGKVKVTVGAGVALACSGDPVYVPADQTFTLDENCDPDLPSPLWVVLCGTEKCCAPRIATCSSDDDEAPSMCTRERDGYEIRVVSKRPECVCGCPEPDDKYGQYEREFETECKCVDPEDPCYEDHYAGKCGCNCDECSNCDCKCILLARLVKTDDPEHPWSVNHRVRRFIRPVLMRDPLVEAEEEARRMKTEHWKADKSKREAKNKKVAKKGIESKDQS